MTANEQDVRRRLSGLFDELREHAKLNTRTELGRPLVVLVSRRMTCAYTLLKRDKHVIDLEHDGIDVYSDRSLEGTPPNCHNRLVYVVDDSIAKGTTLKNRVDTVLELGASRELVHVRVACVDRDRAIGAILSELGVIEEEGGGPPRWASKDVQAFSLELAQMLYVGGIPYFADFPITSPFSIPQQEWQALLLRGSWLVADVTPPIPGGPRSFTFVPTEATLEQLARRVHGPVWALASLFKVRVLRFDNDDCVAIPLGLIGGASTSAIETTLEDLTNYLRQRSHGSAQFSSWRQWKVAAKQRILQMYLASCVLTEFWTDLSLAGCHLDLSSNRLEFDALNSYFGSDVGSALRAFDLVVSDIQRVVGQDVLSRMGSNSVSLPSPIWENELLRTRVALSRELVFSAGLPLQPPAGSVATIDPAFVHSVLSVFGFIDGHLQRESELDAEIDVDTYGSLVQSDDPGLSVRRMGLTMRELEEVLLPEVFGSPSVWTRAVVSLAIDIGNDLGIAVPTTFHDRQSGVVVRQYRTGENSALVNVPLEQLQKKRSRPDGLARLYIQNAVEPKTMARRFKSVGDNGILLENLVHVFHGQIDERVNDQLRATVWSVIDPSTDDDQAVFPLSWLDSSKAALLRPGALFEWVIERQQVQLIRSKTSAELRPIG